MLNTERNKKTIFEKNDEIIKYILNNGKVIGEGSYAKVYEYEFKETDRYKEYIKNKKNNTAWKIVKHEQRTDLEQDYVREISLSAKKGEKIIKCENILIGEKYSAYSTKKGKADLSDLLKNNRKYVLKNIYEIIKQILEILYILEKNEILHRDIKPNNFIYDIVNDKINIKLIDFGLAIPMIIENEKSLDAYALWLRPPEIVACKENYMKNSIYNEKADMWSTGMTILKIVTNEYLLMYNETNEMIEIMKLICEYNKKNNYIKDIINCKIDKKITFEIIDKLINVDINVKDDIKNIIENSLHFNKNKRLSSKEGLNILKINEKIINTEIYNDIKREPYKENIFNEKKQKMKILIRMCDDLEISGETFVVSMDIFDRFIKKIENYKIIDIDLLLCSSILLASKLIDQKHYKAYHMRYYEEFMEKTKKNKKDIIDNLIEHQKYIMILLDYEIYNTKVNILVKTIYEISKKYNINIWKIIRKLIKIDTLHESYDQLSIKLKKEYE